jgi:hypothetical protein
VVILVLQKHWSYASHFTSELLSSSLILPIYLLYSSSLLPHSSPYLFFSFSLSLASSSYNTTIYPSSTSKISIRSHHAALDQQIVLETNEISRKWNEMKWNRSNFTPTLSLCARDEEHAHPPISPTSWQVNVELDYWSMETSPSYPPVKFDWWFLWLISRLMLICCEKKILYHGW